MPQMDLAIALSYIRMEVSCLGIVFLLGHCFAAALYVCALVCGCSKYCTLVCMG